jgi:hypothetical protein
LSALYREYLKHQRVTLTGPKELTAVEGREIQMSLSACNVTSRAMAASVSTGGALRQSGSHVVLKPFQPKDITLRGTPNAGSRASVLSLKCPAITLRRNTPIRITPKSEIVGQIPAGILRAAGDWDATSLPHRSGAALVDKAARHGVAWAIDRTLLAGNEDSAAGFVVYGPYTVRPAGRYVVLFRLKRSADGVGAIARVDATVGGSARPLAERVVTVDDTPMGDYVSIALPFTYSGGRLETRVEWFGKTAMSVDCVTLFQVL